MTEQANPDEGARAIRQPGYGIPLGYLRSVICSNKERAEDIIWDLENKPEFDKNEPNTLGLKAVAEMIVISLTALVVDLDNGPTESDAMREALADLVMFLRGANTLRTRGAEIEISRLCRNAEAALAAGSAVTRGSGWNADCPACIASKFVCDDHRRIAE